MSATGATWQEIADHLGYRSRQAAAQAVARMTITAVPETVEQARAKHDAALQLLQRNDFTRYALAIESGDDEIAIKYSKELRGIVAERAKMAGAYMPERTEVDVTVTADPVALLDKLEQALLERDDQRQLQLQPPHHRRGGNSLSTITTQDAIKAATSVARDIAEGHLDPVQLEQQAVAELQALVGTVVGAGDPLWPLQIQIASGVLAAGGIPTDELAEWLAVQRRRDNPEAAEALSAVVSIVGTDTPPEARSSASGTLSPENDAADDDDDFSDVPSDVIAEAEAAAMGIINEWREARQQ